MQTRTGRLTILVAGVIPILCLCSCDAENGPLTLARGEQAPSQLSVSGVHAYWIAGEGNSIRRIRTDGGSPETLFEGPVSALAVHDGRVFFAGVLADGTVRATQIAELQADGLAVPLAAGGPSPYARVYAMQADEEALYWLVLAIDGPFLDAPTAQLLLKRSHTSDAVETLARFPGPTGGAVTSRSLAGHRLLADEQFLYFSVIEEASIALVEKRLSGAAPVTLLQTGYGNAGLAVDEEHAYFAARWNGDEGQGDEIRRIPKTGGPNDSLVRSDATVLDGVDRGLRPQSVDGLGADGEGLYWLSTAGDSELWWLPRADQRSSPIRLGLAEVECSSAEPHTADVVLAGRSVYAASHDCGAVYAWRR